MEATMYITCTGAQSGPGTAFFIGGLRTSGVAPVDVQAVLARRVSAPGTGVYP